MENKKFSFGIVKGIEMGEVLNNRCLYSGYSGLKYLYNQLQRTSYPLVKEEIEECMSIYAKDYIITFGKYNGRTLEDIYKADRCYIEEYLLKNAGEEVKLIINQYLSNNRASKDLGYNDFQQNAYKKVAKLIEEINDRSSREIILALNMMGFDYKENKGFTECPYCGYNKKGRWPSYLKKREGQTYYIGCEKCDNDKNIITFVQEQYNLTYPEAVKKLAALLGISTDISSDEVVIKDFKPKTEDEIKIQCCCLDEVDLEPFGFANGVMHPYFFHRGYDLQDADIFKIGFAGRKCTNNFKNRVCFTIRDMDGRCVGVIGRSVESEQEFYDKIIEKSRISKDLPYDKQLDVVKKKYEYKKYIFTKGFKKSFTLYNFDKVSKMEKDKIFICEGTLDVVSMADEYGFRQTVGMMGKELGLGQLYQLYKHYKDIRDKVEIYLFIDNDNAGRQGMETNIKHLQELGFTQLYKMVLKNGNDAADSCYQQVKDAYSEAELIPIKYNKKKIVLENVDSNECTILEEI
ncbi:toprim domain-containing protein [Candidatus Clostridium radicumherbarum]|uniref:Toprim domain-containing protein n=1 Tax=Candidatus Clostridium radicumherbarum TaxID=3381662 RepID=A0ABW8U137_9CLOT